MAQKDNTTQVLIKLLKHLKIPVTNQSVSDQLEKHPDYDSFLAYSDVLNNFGIQNAAYYVPHEDLHEVPVPFIAAFTDKTYGVITNMNHQYVTITNERWNNKKMPLSNFLRGYGQSVLVAQATSSSGEQDYVKKRRAEKLRILQMPLALTGLAIAAVGILTLNPGYLLLFSLQNALLAFLKLAGLIISILLLVQSLDANNPLIQKLCGSVSDKNCNAILSSKQAKIWGINWSEIGFCYFAGSSLALLSNPVNHDILQLLTLLNLVALPYTFYSLYYQWQKAKQWCVFCCVVQAVLWLEFFAFLPVMANGISLPAFNGIMILFMAFLLPTSIWLMVKPYLFQLTQLKPLKNQLRTLKYNSDMFNAALKEQPQFATPEENWSIILGNVEAGNVITIVASPYCQPCAKAHLLIDDALNDNGNIQVRIVFVGDNTGEKDDKGRVQRHMMALNQLTDKTIIKKALYDWYHQKQKDYDTWARDYPISLNNNDTVDKLKQQKAWCDVTDIKATPTLLLNGFKLPPSYKVNDLKYMLDEGQIWKKLLAKVKEHTLYIYMQLKLPGRGYGKCK